MVTGHRDSWATVALVAGLVLLLLGVVVAVFGRYAKNRNGRNGVTTRERATRQDPDDPRRESAYTPFVQTEQWSTLPSWHRDPNSRDNERWWDGEQWTQHVRPRKGRGS
jgi:hypothetical protein